FVGRLTVLGDRHLGRDLLGSHRFALGLSDGLRLHDRLRLAFGNRHWLGHRLGFGMRWWLTFGIRRWLGLRDGHRPGFGLRCRERLPLCGGLPLLLGLGAWLR